MNLPISRSFEQVVPQGTFDALETYTNSSNYPVNNSSQLSNLDSLIINRNNSSVLSGLQINSNKNLDGLNQSFTSFPIGYDTVDNTIAEINKIPDENNRSQHLRNYFIHLLDNGSFDGAVKVLSATPTLVYRNSMFKSLIQELVVSGQVNKAISLNAYYPDARVRNDLNQFIAGYLNLQGQASQAAKVLGDTSLINVAKLKAQVIAGSVGNMVSGWGNSISSIWSKPTRGVLVASSANNIVGQQYRHSAVDGGNLACAYAVSQMLKGAGYNLGSAECNTLSRQLEQNGFSKVYSGKNYQPIQGYVDYKPGDVVFFTRSGKNGYGHVGVVSEVKDGVPYMVHNSSSKREVVKVRLDQYYKTPVAVYRPS